MKERQDVYMADLNLDWNNCFILLLHTKRLLHILSGSSVVWEPTAASQDAPYTSRSKSNRNILVGIHRTIASQISPYYVRISYASSRPEAPSNELLMNYPRAPTLERLDWSASRVTSRCG